MFGFSMPTVSVPSVPQIFQPVQHALQTISAPVAEISHNFTIPSTIKLGVDKPVDTFASFMPGPVKAVTNLADTIRNTPAPAMPTIDISGFVGTQVDGINSVKDNVVALVGDNLNKSPLETVANLVKGPMDSLANFEKGIIDTTMNSISSSIGETLSNTWNNIPTWAKFGGAGLLVLWIL